MSVRRRPYFKCGRRPSHGKIENEKELVRRYQSVAEALMVQHKSSLELSSVGGTLQDLMPLCG